MPNYTTKLNLEKPLQTESYNIDVHNANSDKIDLAYIEQENALKAHKEANPIDHPDNSVTDAKIGNRTITDTATAAAGAGTLTNLLSKIGYMIKSITGAANWYTLPVLTIKAIKTALDNRYTKPEADARYVPSPLPVATTTTAGIVKIGSNLTVTNGVVSGTVPYSLPVASATVLGGVKVGTGLTITAGVLSVTTEAKINITVID